MVASCAGSQNEFPTSDVWLFKCDGQGNILTEKSFGGSCFPKEGAEVCKLTSGDFVVVYNKSASIGSTDFWVKGFSTALEPLWEKQVFTSQQFAGPFRIKAIPVANGGFVVAGCKGYDDLVFYKFDKDGNQLDSTTVDDVTFVGNLHLECTDDRVVTVSQTSSINGPSLVEIIAIDL